MSNLQKKLFSINISNINKNNLSSLENILSESLKSKLNNATLRSIRSGISHKFLYLSYLIYIKTYNLQRAEEFIELFDLQKKIFEIFRKYFYAIERNKIETYLTFMKVIFFIIVPEQKFFNKKDLNIENKDGLDSLLNMIIINFLIDLKEYFFSQNGELFYFKNHEPQKFDEYLAINLKILKLQSNALNRLCEIILHQKKSEYLESITKCYRIFLQNIFNITNHLSGQKLLPYLEIYNKTLEVYGAHFKYPIETNSIIVNFKIIFEKLKESQKNNSTNVKLSNNSSTNNLESKNLYELKELAEQTLQLFITNSTNNKKMIEITSKFDKIMHEINSKLVQFNKNIKEIKNHKSSIFFA